MILYNVTINVEQSVEQAWLRWMQTEHVLDVLNTKMFVTARIFRLLNVEQSEGTTTYAVQYFAETRSTTSATSKNLRLACRRKPSSGTAPKPSTFAR